MGMGTECEWAELVKRTQSFQEQGIVDRPWA